MEDPKPLECAEFSGIERKILPLLNFTVFNLFADLYDFIWSFCLENRAAVVSASGSSKRNVNGASVYTFLLMCCANKLRYPPKQA
jgi:hypothetical protein